MRLLLCSLHVAVSSSHTSFHRSCQGTETSSRQEIEVLTLGDGGSWEFFLFAVIPAELLRGRHFLGVEGSRLRLKDEDPVLVTICVFSRGREGPLASVGQG